MRLNGKYNKLLNEAAGFLAIARKEYASGKKKNDDLRIRQGADKAWNASVQAVKALAAYNGKTIPRSFNAQFHFLLNFEKENREMLNGFSYLSMAFKLFASRLHGECFYHGEYNVDVLDSDMQNVSQFIEWIKTNMNNYND